MDFLKTIVLVAILFSYSMLMIETGKYISNQDIIEKRTYCHDTMKISVEEMHDLLGTPIESHVKLESVKMYVDYKFMECLRGQEWRVYCAYFYFFAQASTTKSQTCLNFTNP